MEREHPRGMISDRVWEQLKAALEEAKHSRAGAPAQLSDRDFLEAVLYLNRVGCPWRDLPPELGYWHAVYMRFRRWEARSMAATLAAASERKLRPGPSSVDGLHSGTRPPARGRSTRKNGGDQALGRSRGGLSTKIHAATIDETAVWPSTSPPGMLTTVVSLNLSMVRP